MDEIRIQSTDTVYLVKINLPLNIILLFYSIILRLHTLLNIHAYCYHISLQSQNQHRCICQYRAWHLIILDILTIFFIHYGTHFVPFTLTPLTFIDK